MAPPIVGNGRAFPGHQPWPPAAIPVAVPPSPVAGSLFSHIKWDPHPPFSRFSPLPSLPVVPSHLPAALLSLPRRRPPPAACAASPAHRPAVPSPPPASQPPPLPRRHLRFVGKSPERCPRRQPVALVPLYSLQPAPVRRRCADRRRRLLLRHRGIASFPGITSSSPEARRSGLVVGVQYLPVSGRLLYVAGTPIDVAISSVDVAALSSPPAAPRFRRNTAVSPPTPPPASPESSGRPFLLACLPVSRGTTTSGIAAASGVFHVVPVSVQPLLAVPHRPLAGPGRRRPRPLVVPDRRGVRPSVEPFSSVVRVRQASRCSPVLVFVLGSASSSLVPAASRLRPRIAAEAVPSPFVSVVPVCLRRARSSLSFPRLVAWW
uniref:Cell wall protein-like n=1 Tax=Oryza sativa subsp. japonica TaxID=39947 RepID=Q6EPB4_ORYSJ|nr:cell wall protein-like [Oryza sativa Japonica Group]